MKVKSRGIAIIMTLVIGLSLLFSITGCGDDDDPLGLATLELTSSNSIHYARQGEINWLGVRCQPEDYGPDKPVYVWNISHNGSFVEEIVHDTKPPDTPDTSGESSIVGDDLTEFQWPNSDTLTYTWSEIGTYTAKADLYDFNEYSKDKNNAKILASFTHTIHCDNVRLSLESSPTENTREFTFKATVDNPKYLPFGCPVKWEFIEESTGLPDAGPTEQISSEYSLFYDGVLEVDHRFQKAGKYRAVFTVVGYVTSPIASTQIVVDVSQALQIIVPSGPLKTGEEYTFTARTDSPENLPEAPSYEWDFGDGNGKIIPFSNEVIHLYENPGNYTIRVVLFESDEEAAPLLGIATATVEVEASANHLMELHQMNKFALDFAVQHDYVEGMSGRYSWDFESYGEVIWDGVNFSMQWEQYNHSEVMTGRVSEDGTVIEQLKIRHEFSDTEWYELEIQNLPFWTDTMPDRFIVDVHDKDVGEYVVYFNTYRTAGYQWTDDARLYVRFTRE